MADSLTETEVEKCARNESGTQKQMYPDDKRRRRRWTAFIKLLRKNMATNLMHQGAIVVENDMFKLA